MDLQPSDTRFRRLQQMPDGTSRPMPLAKIRLCREPYEDEGVELAYGPDGGKGAFKVEIVCEAFKEPVVRVHLYCRPEDAITGAVDVRIVELRFADVEFSGLIESLPWKSGWQEQREAQRKEVIPSDRGLRVNLTDK